MTDDEQTQMPTDPISAFAELGIMLHSLMEGFMHGGFTREESFELVREYFKSQILGKME